MTQPSEPKWHAADRKAQKEGARKTVVLPGRNAGTYTGEWANNRFHGRGERVWTSNKSGTTFVYDGQWVDGKRDGQGSLYHIAADTGERVLVYEGGWHADVMHGEGRWLLSSGDVYQGCIERGVRQGQGTLRMKNGDVYEGSFWSNQPEGTGTLVLANGDRYAGQWAHGKRHGRGEHFFASRGKLYRGVWADDCAACGEFVDITDEGNQQQHQQQQQRLPQLELRDPTATLEDAEERAFTTLVDEQSSTEYCDFIDIPTAVEPTTDS